MSKTQKKPACIGKEFTSDSKRNDRGILHSSLITLVLISSFLFSCTKFDVQDPDSVTGYTWVDKPGASSAEGSSSSIAGSSSIAASSDVGTSSVEETLLSSSAGISSNKEISSSSALLTSSIATTSSSSVTASSSSITSLNTQTCTYSASGTTDGSTGTLTCAVESKTYATVVIGTQTWMAENLAWLPSVHERSDISYTDVKCYVYAYNGTDVSAAKSESNYSTYGALYNFPAAIRACPTGWHLPTNTEWTTLENYLGANAGSQLKSSSTLWTTGGIAGSNTSNFSALPGGHYGSTEFDGVGYYGFWCTATTYLSSYAYCRNMSWDYSGVNSVTNPQNAGFSVRCLKD